MATKHLAKREGIRAEPSGAAGLAGLWQLLRHGVIRRGEKVIIWVPGHGFKDPALPEVGVPPGDSLLRFLKLIGRTQPIVNG